MLSSDERVQAAVIRLDFVCLGRKSQKNWVYLLLDETVFDSSVQFSELSRSICMCLAR